MPVPSRDKILISVDGSEPSLNAVRYAASIIDPRRFDIVLLHVLTRVPESFLDLQKMPSYKYRIVSIDSWEQQQEAIIGRFMEKARGILFDRGFSPEKVCVKIHERNLGISRDVAAEAQNDYKAIVVGRKGMGDLKDFVLGGIANRILELSPIPVWIIGGAESPGKILVCMDKSEGAMGAVKHLGRIIGKTAADEVVLLHVVLGFSGFRKFVRDVFGSEDDQSTVESIEKELNAAAKALEPSFESAIEELTLAGVDPSLISRKIVYGTNCANTIIEEAEKGGFDTIIVGRRGISRVEQFVMGRVSSKVIQLSKDMAVWIVS